MDIDDILGSLGDLDDNLSAGVTAPSTDDFLKLLFCVKGLAQLVEQELF